MTLYVGTTVGVYVSQDDGRSWATDVTSIPRLVTALVADPVRTDVAYYGTDSGQVYRTFDGGGSFQPVWPGDGAGILQMAAARFFNLYAVDTRHRLYVSEDMGASFFQRAQSVNAEIVAVDAEQARPWFAYIGTLGGGVFKTKTNAIEWEQRDEGIDNSSIFCVKIDQSRPEVVYAGSAGEVFKTTDGATSWTGYATGLPPDGLVTRIEVDPSDSSTVYASLQDRGIWRSTDGGESWARLVGDSPFVGAIPLIASRVEPGVLFAGTQVAGLYRSGDGGATWAPGSQGMTLFVRAVAPDPVDPNVVYAAFLANGIYKTTDGGANWTFKGLADRLLFDVTLSPDDPNTIYASATKGVARSRDGGETWQDLGQKVAWVFAVASDPTDRATVLSGGIGGALFRSTDGGGLWSASSAGLPARNVLSLAFDPSGGAVYAGTDGFGVYVSNDGGALWQPTGGAFPDGTQVTALLAGPGERLIAATSTDGLLVSGDGGQTWQPGTGLPSGLVSSVTVDPSDPGVLLASTQTQGGTAPGVSRSSDGGLTWVPSATGLRAGNVYWVSADPWVSGRYFAAADDAIYRSVDQGRTWARWGRGISPGSARTLSVDPVVPYRLYAGTAGAGAFVSTNGGATWRRMSDPFGGLTIAGFAPASHPGACYAASLGHGVLDNNALVTGLKGGVETALTSIVVFQVVPDPSDPKVLYAATGGAGVVTSRDGGEHWATSNRGLKDLFVLSLAIDPSNPRRLYAGTSTGGVFASANGGVTWAPLNTGLWNPKVTALNVDPSSPQTVYAGTEGGGLFRLVR